MPRIPDNLSGPQPRRSRQRTRQFNSRTGRVHYAVPQTGTWFDEQSLAEVVPPRNAVAFKIVRRDPGYVRPNNPLGLMTEGPFSIDVDLSDLVGDRAGEIAKIVYDIGD